MAIDEVIGRNVNDLLWARHLRRTALMDALGITRQSLHRKMRGETAWTASDIETAARLLAVEPGKLFGQVTGESLAAFAAKVLRLPLRTAS